MAVKAFRFEPRAMPLIVELASEAFAMPVRFASVVIEATDVVPTSIAGPFCPSKVPVQSPVVSKVKTPAVTSSPAPLKSVISSPLMIRVETSMAVVEA